jgi:hypothetical protein
MLLRLIMNSTIHSSRSDCFDINPWGYSTGHGRGSNPLQADALAGVKEGEMLWRNASGRTFSRDP